jgi:Predicted pyridoxal phosphate-dependent enzyme apparently involved in regulation of cell wall biogenesis
MTPTKTVEIPMSYPDITEAERQAVMEVLHTPNLAMGPKIDAFEAAIAKFAGAKHAIAVNSGTAGLHLCVRAAGFEQNDLVVTTPFSFVASTNVLIFEKAIPVFVDVDPLTGNIDPLKAAAAVRELKAGGPSARHWLPRKGAENPGLLKGMLAVDVFGQPADYDELRKISDSAGIKLIEDSCESLGAEYKGRKTGLLGDYGVFAFYPNKQITTGEGGIIVTNDDKAADFMRALRSQGRAPGDTWLQHTYLGYNYRMDEMSAALGLVQMQRIEELLNKRQQVADWYAERLSEIQGVEAPVLVPETTRVSWFVYVVRFDVSINRDEIAAELKRRGIPVRPYFLPIHLQPYMVEQFGYRPGDFPVTEELGNRGLALPFSGMMSEEQVEIVCQTLRDCIQHRG